MYCNFALIDDEFLSLFAPDEQNKIKDTVYAYYLQCGRDKSKKLSMEHYFSSSHVKYKFVYTYCPKCKKSGILLFPFKKSGLSDLKYCAHCGESNISHRFSTGLEKIEAMISVSELLTGLKYKKAARDVNQQIATLIISVFEVYLRDCYAGILNTKYVNEHNTLFEKFIKECKNDFLNPGKANERFKKELKIDFKNGVGKDTFKKLVELAEYRNVIVHNNGICDKKFLLLNIGNYNLHDTINLSHEEINYYLQAVKDTIQYLDMEYGNIINSHIAESLKLKIATGAPDLMAVYVHRTMKSPIVLTAVKPKNKE